MKAVRLSRILEVATVAETREEAKVTPSETQRRTGARTKQSASYRLSWIAMDITALMLQFFKKNPQTSCDQWIAYPSRQVTIIRHPIDIRYANLINSSALEIDLKMIGPDPCSIDLVYLDEIEANSTSSILASTLPVGHGGTTTAARDAQTGGPVMSRRKVETAVRRWRTAGTRLGLDDR